MASSQLIPGLPNDLAVVCLLSLPAEVLVRVQKVSPLWRIAIQSDRFYVERRRRHPFPSIFAIRRVAHTYEFLDADIADLLNPRLLFSCDDHEGHRLFPPGVVFASVQLSVYGFAPGHHVQRFSLLTRRWTEDNKLFPHGCKLLVSTVGSHVVVLICSEQNHDGEDDGGGNHRSEDGKFAHTVCEILDTHTNQWDCLDGFPDQFHGIHCMQHQGTVYVKGEMAEHPPAVYGLNLTRRRWAEVTDMSAMLHSVQDDCKIILQPRWVLLATSFPDTVKLYQLDASTGNCIEVLSVPMVRSPCSYFLFRQDERIFLVVQGEGSSWKMKKTFLDRRLNILHIPGDLLMVDAIAGF
ncbi:hypothetical protein GOP47_0019127 [Adiantum capillus-veneris]|uniref:F-box domain-containing protein n=1 Tax=Adiantum capillus-veneris TaxID=13818 RepID=A0A9D4Z8T0_ADICA|nr:hypothetical protein GOP47_0019127 [Adiantum capillus-veneris]